MMTLNTAPVFDQLHPDEQARLLVLANECHHTVGDVLCYEGDAPNYIWLLVRGGCVGSYAGEPVTTYAANQLLDWTAALGELPYAEKCTITEDTTLLRWQSSDLWQSAAFTVAARQHLATAYRQAHTCRTQLETPIHFAGEAQLQPGPFLFDDVTLIFAFCDANLDPVREILSPGLKLFHRPGSKRDSMLLAFADFPHAYPESAASARFGYTETTFFVPVRYGRRIGLFAPYIYPSAWEPILLGREIYGFPKRLGLTMFDSQQVSLTVDQSEMAALQWDGMTASDEVRLVRALMDWLGIEGRSAALAFRAGEVLRRSMRLPSYRRIDVFNHKQILSVDATVEAPRYDVDVLTQAVFGVLRWYQVAKIERPRLQVGPQLAGMNITLREAYRTKLDMRLSTGKTIRDYRDSSDEK